MKRGIQERKDSGLKGFGTGGIQRKRGIKERKDSGQEGLRAGGIRELVCMASVTLSEKMLVQTKKSITNICRDLIWR